MEEWIEIDEARFDEMLNILPPAVHFSYGFLVGEPTRDNTEGQPMFPAFIKHRGKFYESLEPMTVREFREIAWWGEMFPARYTLRRKP